MANINAIRTPNLQNINTTKCDETQIQLNSPTANLNKSLFEAMTLETIAAFKTKRLANKRKTIKSDVNVPKPTPSLDSDREATREITSRERVGRTRVSILQAPASKNFAKNVFAILQSIQIKEKNAPLTTRPQPLKPYNRYKQESVDDTAGFKIDTMASYRGLSVKSVTAAPMPRPMPPPPQARSIAVARRVSRTPIIIIPALVTSLITMFNVRDILEDFRFVETEEKRRSGFKRAGEVLVQRRRDGLAVPYRIVDNTVGLGKDEWDRVVAVFVQGAAWQFKGWPWRGPVDVFSKVKGFHLKWEGMSLDPNVAKWAVQVVEFGRNNRHADRAKISEIWAGLDKHVAKNKAHLRF